MKTATIEALKVLTDMGLAPDAEWDAKPMAILITKDGKKFVIALAGEQHPIDQLIGVRNLLKQGAFQVKHEDIAGVIFFVEAYALRSKPHDLEDAERIDRVAAELRESGTRFSDHPESIEIKTYLAIDEDGIVQQSIERGATEVAEISEKDGGEIGGSVAVALRGFFA